VANPALASAAPSAPPRPKRVRPKRSPATTRRGSQPRARPKTAAAQTRKSAQARGSAKERGRARSRPQAKRRPPSPRRVVQPAFAGAAAGAAMLPGAALRSAVAVRDLSDSSLIIRLTRGRGWIAVLSALLFGIVALNVVSLSISAGSGRTSQAIETLERQNSSLRAQLAEQLSASRIEGTAATQGLAVPAPEDISYLSPEDGDLDRLLKQLEQGTLLSGEATEVTSSSEPVSYLPPVSESESQSTTPASAPAPTPEPAPAPTPSAPAPAPSGDGSTGSGGVGL
jgi:hypothetical protein